MTPATYGTTSGRDAPDAPAAQGEHPTDKHKCPVAGCSAGRGQAYPHAMAKCSNCRGPHMAQSNLYPKKTEAWQAVKGWRSPPSVPRHIEGTVAPPPSASPPPDAATAGEEMEMENPGTARG